MTERPILMSGAMVRACMREVDPKGQTRRVVMPQPEVSEQGNLTGAWLRKPLDGLLLPKVADIVIHCPYGKPGDRVWVRETFCFRGETAEGRDRYRYRADENPATDGWKWTPAIHMPRRACRLVLEVTGVRI
jgi:hypothetical protein